MVETAMNRTHCRHGHELTEENTVVKAGAKRCLICWREAARNSQRRRRGQDAPPVDAAKSEACRRGGQKTASDRGHMARIGRIGDQAAALDAEKASERGKRGGAAQTPEHLAEIVSKSLERRGRKRGIEGCFITHGLALSPILSASSD